MKAPLRPGGPAISLISTLSVLALLLAACGAPSGAPAKPTDSKPAAEAKPTAAAAPTTAAAPAAAPAKPDAGVPAFAGRPVDIQIIDVAGNQQLTKPMIDNYQKANPDKVGNIDWIKATAPELAGKIKAQQDAGRVEIGLVMSGFDGMAAGVEQNLWLKLLPEYNAKFPNLEQNYLDPAKRANDIAKGFGIVSVYYPSGPLLEYMPDKVKTPPKTAQELLTWAKENQGKFMYARPANSGPGRTLLMGLPYILGDKDPMDPVNGWEKTWNYLRELDQYIEYYPNGTGATMKELGEGTRFMIASTTGWDINPRVLGTVPKEAKVAFLENFQWVGDAHFMLVPTGLDNDRLAVVLDLMAWVLKPDQQAYAYDAGYFYPGPAVKNVTLEMAPAESQAQLKEFGRPEYDEPIAKVPVVMPLDPKPMVTAFEMWDKLVGGKVKQ
jgi:putative spermidine/putrescine transport system substrate-binding protein